jgi:hypothetical protein
VADVIFARVAPELKAAVDSYSNENGMTLAGAVGDLLARGLETAASEESVEALRRRLAETQLEASELRRLFEEERVRAITSSERERNLQQFLTQLDATPIGPCPQKGCVQRVSAIDLVVRRTCKAGHSLTSLLEQVAKTPGMDSREALVAVGALGLVLALIAAGGQKPIPI